MTGVAWAFLATAAFWAGLYTAARRHVEQLRDDLADAYQQRDDAESSRHAAEAKAAQCARLLRAVLEDVPDDDGDVFLMTVEADLDPEAHALADVLSANDATDGSEVSS